MSHQFSILQPFLGYNSAQSQLLTTSKQVVLLQIILKIISIKDCQQIEIVLLAVTGKFKIQVSRIFSFFQQISLYWNGLRRFCLFYKWCHPPTGRFKTLKNQYIYCSIKKIRGSACEERRAW